MGEIEFQEDVLTVQCQITLWDLYERGLVNLIHRFNLAVGLWGDASLWLDMLGKLRVPNW